MKIKELLNTLPDSTLIRATNGNNKSIFRCMAHERDDLNDFEEFLNLNIVSIVGVYRDDLKILVNYGYEEKIGEIMEDYKKD